MQLKELDVVNWRNVSQASVIFTAGLNYVYGPNGAGKTSLLEAVSYLAFARSFRKGQGKDLIRDGATQTSLKGLLSFTNQTYTKTVEVMLNEETKQVKVDGNKTPKLSAFVGTVLVSIFTPRDVFLFKDEPGERRRVMDETLSAVSPKYLYDLQRYRKLLKERNQALIQSADLDVLKVLTDELISFAFGITQERLALAAFINEVADKYFQALFGPTAAKLSFVYHTNSSLETDFNAFHSDMLYRFERRKSYEALRKATAIGPHLDDLTAYLNDKAIANMGSQGQNRLAALSLILTLAEWMKEKKGETPLLILDDVMSDLDGEKKQRLTATLKNLGQSIVSGSEQDLPADCHAIKMQDGAVVEEKGEN